MAIVLINKGGTIPELIGLSSDTKPTANMPVGAMFTESDTGKQFKYSGTAWFPLVIATSITGSLANDITLLDAVTVATAGVYTLQGEKTITIEIYGTSTSRTIVFQAKSASGTARNLIGVRTSDLSMATSTNGTAEIWQFDVTGCVSFVTDLTAVAGGNVTIKGKAVA